MLDCKQLISIILQFSLSIRQFGFKVCFKEMWGHDTKTRSVKTIYIRSHVNGTLETKFRAIFKCSDLNKKFTPSLEYFH